MWQTAKENNKIKELKRCDNKNEKKSCFINVSVFYKFVRCNLKHKQEMDFLSVALRSNKFLINTFLYWSVKLLKYENAYAVIDCIK